MILLLTIIAAVIFFIAWSISRFGSNKGSVKKTHTQRPISYNVTKQNYYNKNSKIYLDNYKMPASEPRKEHDLEIIEY